MHRSPVSRSVGALMTALVAFQLALTATGVACIMPRDAMPAVAQGSAAMRTGAPMAASTMAAGESTRHMDMGMQSIPERAPCNQQMRWPSCQLRVRPLIMTVTAVVGGLLPILWSEGTGADVMKRLAAPMVGGMVSATLLTLIVIPAIYSHWKERELRQPERRE